MGVKEVEDFIFTYSGDKCVKRCFLTLENREIMSAVYIDVNNILHQLYTSHLGTPKTETYGKALTGIMITIHKQIDLFKPKLLFLAFDGVPNLAKIPHQIGHRQDSFRGDMERMKKTHAKYKEFSQPEKMRENVLLRHEMSPGTPFMEYLSTNLRRVLRELQESNNPLWKELDVIISDTHVPGEGEIKIIRFIRTYMVLRHTFRGHAIMGKDSDTSLMAVGIPLEKIFTYCYKSNDDLHSDNSKYQVCDIGIYREIILENILETTTIDKMLMYRQIYDFLFMCVFRGNDYIIEGKSFSMRVLRIMLEEYQGDMGLFLTDFTSVCYENLRPFLARVAYADLLSNEDNLLARLDRRIENSIGSGTQEDSARRLTKSVQGCIEMIMTGETSWPWCDIVYHKPSTHIMCMEEYGSFWNKLDQQRRHMDPLIHWLLVMPFESLEYVSEELLPPSYKQFRHDPEIRELYGKFDAKNEGASSSSSEKELNGEELVKRLEELGEREFTEEQKRLNITNSYPLFLPSRYGSSELMNDMELAPDQDPQLKVSRMPFHFQLIPYTKELWETQLQN